METFEKRIGKRIRDLRKSKGLDQQTLAQRAGLARSYITLIEGGKKTAAVSTLALIADALGVVVGEFFEDTDKFRSPKISVSRGREVQPPSQEPSHGYTFTPLSREKKRKIMDPFLVRLEPKTVQKYPFIHKGEEFDYVLQGRLRLVYEDEEVVLEAGDSVYFDAAIPHRLEVLGDETVYILSVNSAALQCDPGGTPKSSD